MTIKDHNNKDIIISTAYKSDNRYNLSLKPVRYKEITQPKRILLAKEANDLYHQRLSHCSNNALAQFKQRTTGIKETIPISYNNLCESCLASNLKNKIYKKTTSKPTRYYLEKLHTDLIGKLQPDIYNRQYIITFLDNYTRYLEIDILRYKSEALKSFQNFIARADNNREQYTVQCLVSNNGGEYISKEFTSLLENKGIIYQHSSPNTHEPNGIIEIMNQTLIVKVRAIIHTANIPFFYFIFFIQYSYAA